MSVATALCVEGVTKRYASSRTAAARLALRGIVRDLAGRDADAHPHGDVLAVDELSFALAPGEALAVLGRNGAGKSTLLKLLSGVIKPDAGIVRARGRIGALLELGTGFDPLLTGRENIALAAAIRGLSPREAATATAEIAAFADLGAQLDSPVQQYSSGMVARLGFAVAAHLRPAVLLVDEALAVGDFAFQRRCVAYLREFLADGGALVLVTHNVFLAQTVCERGIVLERGSCVFAGPSAGAVAHYLADREQDATPEGRAALGEGDTGAVIEDLRLRPVTEERLRTGGEAEITLRYRVAAQTSVVWGFSIWTGDHSVCVTGDIDVLERSISGSGTLSCRVPALPLLGGSYALRGFLADAATLQPVALYGYGDGRPPSPVSVALDADRRANALVGTGQLVSVDVDWSR